MASKLNPGADAVLASMAYRSAAANTPGDYSDILESAALSYEKTMEARSEMWGSVVKLGANIGADMIDSANELSSYIAKASGLDPDAAKMLEEEIYGVKDDIKALGFLDFSRETRKERAKLKLKQRELFAEIDLAVESINTGADAVKNGLYDAELANLNKGDAEKVHAIIRSNLKDKNTKNGNYAKLGSNENTGELMYTLYRSDTNELADNPDGSPGPVTMTISEFNKSITNNVKDANNAVGTNLSAIESDVFTIGKTHKNGVIDDQTKQLALNRLDGILQTDTDLRRAMLAKYGFSNTSFIDDLNTKGAVSANLYGGMLRSLGLGEGSQIPAEGAFEGIADTDGTKGLSLSEINTAKAYNTYVDNIISMKDPEASKAAFKASFADRMDESHTYGYSNRKIKAGSETTDGDFVNLRAGKSSNIGANTGNGYVPNTALNTIGKKINDRDIIDLGADKFIWDNDKKAYTLNGETINNKYSLFSTIYGENFDPANIISMYNGIKDWTVDTRQEETFDVQTNLDINFVNKKDQDVASDLNDVIPSPGDTRNPNAYIFKSLSPFENMTGIYKEGGGIEIFPEVYPDGHPKAGQKHPRAGEQAWFRTKGETTKDNTKNLAEMIDLLQTFGLYEYIEKQLP